MSVEFNSEDLIASHLILARYWGQQCQDGALPKRSDMDLTQLAEILPKLVLLSVTWQGGQMRLQYQMAGNAGIQMANREVTGSWLHDLYSEKEMNEFYDLATRTFEEQRPVVHNSHLFAPGREHIPLSLLACPLSDDGATLTSLILVIDYPELDPAP